MKDSPTRLSFWSPFSADAGVVRKRRNLPHWFSEGAIYWVTFRLADALPEEKLRPWRRERDAWLQAHPKPWDDETWKTYNELFSRRMHAWLDAGYGSRALANADVRGVLREALCRFDGDRLNLHAAVIMPTHVHALLDVASGQSLKGVLKGIKGASARGQPSVGSKGHVLDG